MDMQPASLILIGLMLAVWTGGAAWLMIAAAGKARKAEAGRKAARRLARMLDEAPAVPVLVRADGRIEASDRLARWLGLDRKPQFLSELAGGASSGLSDIQIAELKDCVAQAQKTGAPFRLAYTLPGTERSIAIRGTLADAQVSPGGSALLWIFDFSESERELTQLRQDTRRAQGDFAALVGLIEAAPIPMWFRSPDGVLTLVNSAYVAAVGAVSADEVIADQRELIEPVDGLNAREIAQQAAGQKLPVERIVASTIDGQRRTLRVSDLPLGAEGIAGYAVDIEELEEKEREYRAFREAQRAMLDQLSVGVAQFDDAKRIIFANQPFRRIFSLAPGNVEARTGFDRLLSTAREAGRTPEVRDFPAWRAERVAWFDQDGTQEEAWPLSDGTHLRIVAQPMPDGGMVLVAEDRTEQLALSATRDTLLRTRTATLDSLFEALAVFAPDGKLQLWNRSFAGTWGLEPEKLDGHPSIEDLLGSIAPNLAKPEQSTAIGEIVRSATLDRQQKGGRIDLADGRTLEFAGLPLPDGNGLLTVLDITDSQKAEDALRERNQALEDADAVKARFLANMSYEFRTPLTSIGGFAELLASGVAGELSEQGDEYVAAILDSVSRLTEQVENVLDLSQSEAGQMPIRKKPVAMMPFVTDVVRQRADAIESAGLTLDLRGNEGGKINADVRQLGRAVGHILDNAIAATPDGGKILISVSKKADGARIIISDSGKGMDKAELARALDGLRPTENGSGLERRQGLGIPLARQLIEAHGGQLEILSEPGAGTTATISVP